MFERVEHMPLIKSILAPRSVLLAPVLFLLASPAVQAQFSCTGGGNNSGNWTTASSWTNCNGTYPNNGQPSGSDTYDATVTNGDSTLSSAVTVDNVTIDPGAS